MLRRRMRPPFFWSVPVLLAAGAVVSASPAKAASAQQAQPAESKGQPAAAGSTATKASEAQASDKADKKASGDSTGKSEPDAAPAAKAPATSSARATVKDPAAVEKIEKDLGLSVGLQSFMLDNGLQVFVVEDHSTPAFSLHFGFAVGSRDEDEGRSGFAHLFEHMMFKGSKNIPEGGHFKYIEGAGGQTNAFTSHDQTHYFDTLPSHYLDMALWLEADRLRSLEVTDENFENQRSAVKEEKALRIDNVPYAGAVLDFMAQIWTGTGYGHSPIGTIEDLEAATTNDAQAFFDRWYAPNNATLTIVGDVDFQDVRAKVQQYFGDIPRGQDRPAFPAVDHRQTSPMVKKVEDPLARQPLYVIGWKTAPQTHADSPALELLLNILLRGDSSRITKILKDEKQLVLESLSLGQDFGGVDAGSVTSAFIPVEGVGFEAIEKVVKEEIQKVKKRGITKQELEKAVNQVTVDTVQTFATNQGRAFSITKGAVLFEDPLHAMSELAAYRAVTAKDIKRVANQYLTDNWLVLQVVPKK